jgi:hypothetical protein
MRRTLLPLLALAGFLAPLPALALTTDHVILVFVDGPRYAESFGEPTRIPRIWNDLRPAGSILTDYRNEGYTLTCSGHATTLTGSQQNLANDGSEYPHDMTLAERDRRVSGAPAEDFWVVAGKSKLHMLAHSDDPLGGAAYGSADSVGTGGDTSTMEVVLSLLALHQPRFMAINLPDVDLRGHALDWNGYLAAISQADALIGQLWDFLQTDPAFAGHSTLVITADHGRHDNRPLEEHDGFQNHGDSCEGCRHIFVAAAGAGIRSDTVVAGSYGQVDLAATLAQLLAIDSSGMEGFPIYAMLEPPTATQPFRSSQLRLLGAQPSPFRGDGGILLRANEGRALSLRIYDPRGRLVRELRQEARPAGEYLMHWDGRDLAGRRVASGVYHLVLEDAQASDRGPLLFLR